MNMNEFIVIKVKEAVENDGYIFAEMFFDNGTIYASEKGNNERIELSLFDYLIKIEM